MQVLESRRQQAVVVLAVVTVLVLAVVGVRVLRSAPEAAWPDRVAVVGLQTPDANSAVTFLAIADPVRKSLVYVPKDAVVEVPRSGFLRAFHAYRLGGTPLVRGTLGRLFGVTIPFAVAGAGGDVRAVSGVFEFAEMPSEEAETELRRLLLAAEDEWQVLRVAGTERATPSGSETVLDEASLLEAARALGGTPAALLRMDPKMTAPPAPSATPDPETGFFPPSTITVEVRNGGVVDLAATKTAERLRGAGYDVVGVGDERPKERETSVVLFGPGRDRLAAQVAELLGYPAEPLPAGVQTEAEVLVLLGDDADV